MTYNITLCQHKVENGPDMVANDGLRGTKLKFPVINNRARIIKSSWSFITNLFHMFENDLRFRHTYQLHFKTLHFKTFFFGGPSAFRSTLTPFKKHLHYNFDILSLLCIQKCKVSHKVNAK